MSFEKNQISIKAKKIYYLAVFCSISLSYIWYFLPYYCALPFFETLLIFIEINFAIRFSYYLLLIIGILIDTTIGDCYFLTTQFLLFTTLSIRKLKKSYNKNNRFLTLHSNAIAFLSIFLKILVGLYFFGKTTKYCIQSIFSTFFTNTIILLFCLTNSIIDDKIKHNKGQTYKK